MANYDQVILTKDSVTFKGNGLDDKTVSVKDLRVLSISSIFADFSIGNDRTVLYFGVSQGKYKVTVTPDITQDGTYEVIPITVGLILDTKKELLERQTKTPMFGSDETIEIGTVKTTGSGLNVKSRRTKRNRRGRKGGKTRKLATWCS